MVAETPWHGLILVDKPSGMTSHDVVAKLRRVYKTKAVGHTGTLDPMASGLMVCLLNEGTKLSQYILEGDKGYHLGALLGVSTDTLDITGQILSKQDVAVSSLQLRVAMDSLMGEFEWEVPKYSAIKVDGQKLYEYARQGEEVLIPKKLMKFWQLENQKIEPSQVSCSLKCSKGSYIRTWIQKLGEELGVPATMNSLRRFYSAPYYLEQAVALADLEVGGPVAGERAFVSMEKAMPFLKTLRVKGHDENMIRNGQISHDLRARLIVEFDPAIDHYVQIHSLDTQKLLALVGIDPKRGLVIKRGFQY
ncbi:MAG: tRNA pseudouridine(55) synthase TruB [Bdellovibrionia bacterium]